MSAQLQQRLPEPSGQLIDRHTPLAFTFEGTRYNAYSGDTIASALAANGVRVLSRSFKYHRPRGIMSLTAGDANTLVEVNGIPNVLAEQHRLADGDVVRAQNYFGSLTLDLNAWIGMFGRYFPAGFYYRRFYKPLGAWRFWEPVIRRMAGLGKLNTAARHGYFDKKFLFADVAVVGAGPAGISAAVSAAQSGARVLLITQSTQPGGGLRYGRTDAGGTRAGEELARMLQELQRHKTIRVLTDARVEGCFADNWLAVVRDRRLYKLRAGRIVVATGAFEQPAVFRNNDLPGITYGSTAQRLMRLYGVQPGSKAVVLTVNEFGYSVCLDLADAGIAVAAVIDMRSTPPDSELRRATVKRTIRIENGATISEAYGRKTVQGVRVARIGLDGAVTEQIANIDCDLVCMSTGFAPNLALAAHRGAHLYYDPRLSMHRPAGLPATVTVAGAANCRFRLEAAIADGERAGLGTPDSGASLDQTLDTVTHPSPIVPHADGKDFVDFDEDLTTKDIADTVRSGFVDIQLLKRYSTAGMGPSQGRHSSVNVIRLAAIARNEQPGNIGTTTFRPPYSGESFGVLAGRASDPVRRTAMHHRHLEAGAQMMVAGTWMRPAHYGRRNDAAKAITREVAAVRGNVGLIDVSTLGKLEIRGPGAGDFLNRIYATGHLKQPVGRARYALATDMTGTVVDDGIISRLSDHHFFVTTTTSALESVARAMYLWNSQWRLDIDITNVTAAYAAVNLAGPRSREVLAQLCDDVDLTPQAFPYMGVRTGTLAGVPVRLMRVGFVGELGYEIHFPSSCGEFVWDRILEAGARWNIVRFGVEAQRILRLEKGHIIVGQDTDGLTCLLELGMTGNSLAKPFFVGGAALRAFTERGAVRKLVGFTVDAGAPLPKECHLIIENGAIAGHVTSCVLSQACAAAIGLAYVPPSRAEPGTEFTIRGDHGRLVRARVTTLPFYDLNNERQTQ